MSDAKLGIDIGVDSKNAQQQLEKFTLSVGEVEHALKELKAQRLNIIDDGELAKSNQAIARLTEHVKNLKNVGVDGFDEFGKKIASTSGPIQESISGIRKLANILPGIGVAGIIGGAASLLVELAKGFFTASTAAETLNKALADGAANAGDDIAQLSSLSSIVKDETVSRKARTKALQELQDLYPNYFKNMTLEKTSMDDIRIATDKVTDALVRQAQIKGLSDEIGKLSAERSKLSAENIGDTFKSASLLDEIKISVSALASGAGAAGDVVAKIAGNKQDRLKVIDDQVKALTDSLKQLNIVATGDELGEAPKIPKPKKAPKVKAETRLQEEPLRFGTLLDTSNFDPEIDTVQKKLDKLGGLKLHFDRDFLLEDANEVAENINQILKDGTKSGIISLADSIGNAIGSGQNVLAAAMGSLLDFLGTGIQEIGKQLIVIGSIATVAATAIKALLESPGLSIAAGVLFIAAGAALKSKANNIHAFADGGVVTGPTNALVGEAGTEVIFPLNKLNQFLKGNTAGGGGVFIPNVRLKGQDMIIAFNRAQNNQGLV